MKEGPWPEDRWFLNLLSGRSCLQQLFLKVLNFCWTRYENKAIGCDIASVFRFLTWSSFMPGSRTWPDLVGKDADEAKNIILAESPYLLVQILPEHAMVTMDYNIRRIRLFCNSERKVTKVPGVGWCASHLKKKCSHFRIYFRYCKMCCSIHKLHRWWTWWAVTICMFIFIDAVQTLEYCNLIEVQSGWKEKLK